MDVRVDHKEGWVLKNLCFWTVVLEKTLESLLDCKEIQPLVNPKGNQSWIFTGRTDVEAETPILWPPDAKSWLIGKDPDAGKDWGQEEKGTTEDEIVGWHHWLNGLELEQDPGDGEEPDAGKDWGQEEKGTIEDEMVAWHHRLNQNDFEQAPEVGDGQESLAGCSLWVPKDPDMTEQLN